MVVMFNAIYSPSPVAVGTAQGFLLVILGSLNTYKVWRSGYYRPIHQLEKCLMVRKDIFLSMLDDAGMSCCSQRPR